MNHVMTSKERRRRPLLSATPHVKIKCQSRTATVKFKINFYKKINLKFIHCIQSDISQATAETTQRHSTDMQRPVKVLLMTSIGIAGTWANIVINMHIMLFYDRICLRICFNRLLLGRRLIILNLALERAAMFHAYSSMKHFRIIN